MREILVIGGESSDRELNKRAQEYMFKLGYRWWDTGQTYRNVCVDYGRVAYLGETDGTITYSDETFFLKDCREDYEGVRVVDISKVYSIPLMETE